MKIEDNQIRIIDNFLPDDIFKEFQNIFLDEKFPWYFNNTSVYDDDNSPQFCHAIYMDMEPISYCWEYIKPILINGLNLKNYQSILRVKVNATPAHSSGGEAAGRRVLVGTAEMRAAVASARQGSVECGETPVDRAACEVTCPLQRLIRRGPVVARSRGKWTAPRAR